MPQNQAQVNSLRTAVGIPKPRSEMYESILPYFATKSVCVNGFHRHLQLCMVPNSSRAIRGKVQAGR